MELFGNEGFDATTNRAIAKAAGVSSAALYHYFPSKADIYVAVCDAILATFRDVFAKVAAKDETLMGRLSLLMRENLPSDTFSRMRSDTFSRSSCGRTCRSARLRPV